MYTIEPSLTLVFAPMYNTGKKKDATGAFQPEAKRFCEYHGIDKENLILIDNKKPKYMQKAAVLDRIADEGPGSIDSLVFFCHGFRSGFQFGFKLKDANDLAACVEDSTIDYEFDDVGPSLIFYSCDMARDLDRDRDDDTQEFGGDGGMADTIRDALCVHGMVNCRVVAHSTTGHTDKNPYAKFFDGQGSPIGGVGGQMPVSRKSPLWKSWVHNLRKSKTFRFAFPYMTIGDVHTWLLEHPPQ